VLLASRMRLSLSGGELGDSFQAQRTVFLPFRCGDTASVILFLTFC